MRMAYSMYGKHMGSLSIIVIQDGREKELFKKEGDQGKSTINDLKNWFDTCVDLPASGKFQVVVQAKMCIYVPYLGKQLSEVRKILIGVKPEGLGLQGDRNDLP